MVKNPHAQPPVPSAPQSAPSHIAVIGAGMAGIACALALVKAGLHVSIFEKSRGAGGRMSTRETEFGSFDHGAQYFTVRDARFQQALENAQTRVRPWSASTVQILDALGQVVAASLPPKEAHWVATPGMNALLRHWAEPLLTNGTLHLQTEVSRIEPDAVKPGGWQLLTEGAGAASPVASGFDAVVLAVPSVQAHALLLRSQQANGLMQQAGKVRVAPCWTLMLAFPQALHPELPHLGPDWNAARSTHHRIAWLARESSKPGRGALERWTVQASADWSERHLEDDAERVKAKLLKAFAEVTGIRAAPPFAAVHRWRYAQTTEPLGQSFAWDGAARIGMCGDWCLGHRVENAFVSGVEMAEALVAALSQEQAQALAVA